MAAMTIEATSAFSNLDGGVGNDTILGGTFNDTIYGGDDSDSINAKQGDDSIAQAAGSTIDPNVADTIDGGLGRDLVEYTTAAGGVHSLQTSSNNTGAAAGGTDPSKTLKAPAKMMTSWGRQRRQYAVRWAGNEARLGAMVPTRSMVAWWRRAAATAVR
jgi:Ca2+-binding RTX toxin-like protein